MIDEAGNGLHKFYLAHHKGSMDVHTVPVEGKATFEDSIDSSV